MFNENCQLITLTILVVLVLNSNLPSFRKISDSFSMTFYNSQYNGHVDLFS